jgi:hypothetical protein
MAQTGFTPIITYHSTTPSAVPTAGNLAPGELGLNIADMKLYCENSSGVVTLLASAANTGTVTSVGGTGTVNGLTLTGTVTTSGNLTLGGTLSNVSLTTAVTGTLPVANGGTGQTTYTDGQLLIGNTSGNTLAKGTLTAGSGISITNGAGSITIAATGGVGTVTSVNGTGTVNGITLTGTVTSSGDLTLGGTLSNVSLTTQVTGTLPAANGGTGITSLGSGVATWLGTPSSANLAAAVTDETGSGALVFATTPVITGLQEKSTAVAASDINLSLGNYFTKTISGTTTFTVSNIATSGDVAAFILVLTNGGAYTVNWFSGVTWAGGTPPSLTASGVDLIGFFTINGGTTWRGLVLGLDMQV